MTLGLGCRTATVCLVSVMLGVAASGIARAQDDRDLNGIPMAGMSGSQMVRGIVTAATSDHLSIKTEKGESYAVAVTINTRVMKDRQPLKFAAIRAGDSVGAMGVMDAPAKTVHALFVMVVDAQQLKKAREELGKLYIAGKVTAIDELRLTILRPDNVTQVIAVDEGTSFRKGGRQMTTLMNGVGPLGNGPGGASGTNAQNANGESITLGDIKVGDSVAGKGEMKGGIFTPTQLSVMDAATRQRRRNAEAVGSTLQQR